jgi:Asp-tRNA(Asn)/Glu-tRNA(Gln) amidotransferase A subunit family amidase
MTPDKLVRFDPRRPQPEIRALTIQPSLTEILFHGALQRAAELDKYFLETGKTIGPLHGVPVTVKDQFNVKGVDSTLGYVGRCFHPASEDAVLVQLLKSMGAVIIAKSNLPQSIMVTTQPLLVFLPPAN